MKEASPLTVATFNTFGIPVFSPHVEDRYRAFSAALENTAPDVINLQEVHTYRLLHLLKECLPSYPFVLYKRAVIGAKGGLVTFSRHPLEMIDYVSFQSSGKSLPNRIFGALNIKDKGSLITQLQNMPLAIVNTHLTANRDNDWSKDTASYFRHQVELEQLARLIERTRKLQRAVIVSGDFNVAKGSELYQRFVQTTHVHDIFHGDMRPTYHQDYLPDGQASHCIDYLFYISTDSKTVMVSQTSLLFQDKTQLPNGKEGYLSDHIGLLAELMISS
jgi:exonuclease III